jgi:hypothetical protein
MPNMRRYLAPFLAAACIFFCVDLCIASGSPAGKSGIQDRMIGSAFKALAKVFTASADIGKIQKENIRRIQKMDEAKFRRRYAAVYAKLKDCRALASQYGLKESMSRQEAVVRIRLLSKESIYRAIDMVPDSFIAAQFRHYLVTRKEAVMESGLAQQVNGFWQKIIRKSGG